MWPSKLVGTVSEVWTSPAVTEDKGLQRLSCHKCSGDRSGAPEAKSFDYINLENDINYRRGYRNILNELPHFHKII